MAPSLLFHSNIATYPSEPDSFLAVVRLPKSASLDSIVITPLGLRPFYYHQPDSNLDDGQTPTRPAEIDLLFNARYPPSPLTQSATISTLPLIPSTKAPKGWKPNSLHKSTLSYNPFLRDSDGAPPGIDSTSPLAIQQFEIGMPLDVTTTLVVLRCPFSIITLSLYGYPSTSLSAVADREESSMAGWETYLYNLSAGSQSNSSNNSFENVLLSVISARPNHPDRNATKETEKCGQYEEDMAVDGFVLKEIADHPLQERLNEILKSLTHLIESSEEASTLHNEDTTEHLIRDTSSQPSSSISPEPSSPLYLWIFPFMQSFIF
ncbi:hypothetical protein [Phaffia rhodozyma]|uniref:Uncharacterized protein n=1 Tax=Phaffia rhodozyma TaxID=264483 RepID=A0A0F7SVJ7_PHARH|nr:hypothetical protein [Phaffia rhodozyma]